MGAFAKRMYTLQGADVYISAKVELVSHRCQRHRRFVTGGACTAESETCSSFSPLAGMVVKRLGGALIKSIFVYD